MSRGCVWAKGALYEAPFTPRSQVGRSGRGDTCLASYLAARIPWSRGRRHAGRGPYQSEDGGCRTFFRHAGRRRKSPEGTIPMSRPLQETTRSAGGKLRVGMVGLGRLGKRHAENLANRVGDAEVAAACSLVPEELEWARKELGVEALYDDYGKMITEVDLDAVFIASSSSVHAAQIARGLERGLHVFCEKPMGVSVEECLAVERAVAAHPDRTSWSGSSAASSELRYAKRLIDEGAIGKPFLVAPKPPTSMSTPPSRSSSSPAPEDIPGHEHPRHRPRALVSRRGGGECLRDRRKFCPSGIRRGGRRGQHLRSPEVRERENGRAIRQQDAFHGHDTHTEIAGSKGIIKIGRRRPKPGWLFDASGARVECVRDFYERFAEGFLAEAREFVACARAGKASGIEASDGTKATEVGFALAKSSAKGRS